MSPDVLYLKEKEPLVIPCRVTSPNVTTELVKVCAGDVLFIYQVTEHLLNLMHCAWVQRPALHHDPCSDCVWALVSHFVLLRSIAHVPFSAHHRCFAQFFQSGLTYARDKVFSHVSLSRSFATLFLSWQPLQCGVCVRLFVSVCGYVWKCVRICLWVLALECWVRGRAERVKVQTICGLIKRDSLLMSLTSLPVFEGFYWEPLLALFLPLETGHGVWSAPLATGQHHFPHLTLYIL